MTRLQHITATLLLAACGLALPGCAANKQGTPPPKVSVRPANDGGNAVFANQLPEAATTDGSARNQRIRVVQLEVFQIEVPFGAVSRSEEFWKHVDEQTVDVGTYDLLRKNGWRVGVGPTTEWAYFRDIIDAYPASTSRASLSTGPAGGTGTTELPLKDKKGIPYQNIWYFDDANSLRGLTFERCDNVINVAVQHVPRKPGEARVTVCPVVRSLRYRFEVTRKNDERIIEYVQPEHLYDLNLQTDIPVGHFLVIAPAPEVKWRTSLGATFLVNDGAAERIETLLLMVPRAIDLAETITRPAAAAPAAPGSTR